MRPVEVEAGMSHGSKIVYQRLRARGYDVFAVNPNADEVEGDTCFHDLKSIPGGVDGGCPLMFEPTADFGHKAMRFVCTMTGKVPRRV
ncbi:MAG: CoA-binding protein [Actinobacteria bacterium]|nr:CoA-binding protein [Actinomycetota bacterium]